MSFPVGYGAKPSNDLVHISAKKNGSALTLLWILNHNIFSFLE